TWQARDTSGASRRAAAARSRAWSTEGRSATVRAIRVLTAGVRRWFGLRSLRHGWMRGDLLQQLGDPLHLGQPDVLLELQVGSELQPHLLAEDASKVRSGRLQPGLGGSMVSILAKDGVEDVRLPKVG